MKELQWPIDCGLIMKKKKSLKRQLLADGTSRIKKKIAVLGGSTTDDVVTILELFLLDRGIEPEFWQSEYACYWQDGVFGNPELEEFKPDVIYIHTSLRNLENRPTPTMTYEQVQTNYEAELNRWEQLWNALEQRFGCPVIQNNFEQPDFRLMGSYEASDRRGLINFLTRMNLAFYDASEKRQNLYINDINWLSAAIGLEKFSDPQYWYLYKYFMSVPVIPEFSLQLAAVIGSLFGRNKKALALDLDNTLWGGVVGDDGADKLTIGQENAEAMAYYEFQQYIKSHKDIGVILTVASKNDEENAIAGLEHPEGALRPDDFISIKANWDPKDRNICQSAADIGILPDSFVFVDDNPAERALVEAQIAGISVPEMNEVSQYIRTLDRNRYFEVTSLSADDLKRNEMYKANAERQKLQSVFESYDDYLLSLEMKARITDFEPAYIDRVAQLTNKSNQFNVTTRRYSSAQIAEITESDKYIRLCGKLTDKFGENGVVSVVFGEIRGKELHIDVWLMSCRVLKRSMEQAMLDELVRRCREEGIEKIIGYYFPTAKNKMVAELFDTFGFDKISESEDGSKVYELPTEGYENQNHVIAVNI